MRITRRQLRRLILEYGIDLDLNWDEMPDNLGMTDPEEPAIDPVEDVEAIAPVVSEPEVAAIPDPPVTEVPPQPSLDPNSIEEPQPVVDHPVAQLNKAIPAYVALGKAVMELDKLLQFARRRGNYPGNLPPRLPQDFSRYLQGLRQFGNAPGHHPRVAKLLNDIMRDTTIIHRGMRSPRIDKHVRMIQRTISDLTS